MRVVHVYLMKRYKNREGDGVKDVELEAKVLVAETNEEEVQRQAALYSCTLCWILVF